jgi:hypothetical protein
MYIISNTYVEIEGILEDTVYSSSLSLSSSIKNALLQEISLNVELHGTLHPKMHYSSSVYANKIKNSYGNELLNIVKQHPIIRQEYLQISGYMFNIIPATRCKL